MRHVHVPRLATAAGLAAALLSLATAIPASAADAAPAGDGQGCPLHAAHMAAAEAGTTTSSPAAAQPAAEPEQSTTAAYAAHRAEVDARGDIAMGFRQDATTHHFRISPTGGVIEVTVRAAEDTGTLAQVRAHFQEIAQAFAAGDFSIPAAVHAEEVPGTAAMQRAGSAIEYRYREIAGGAQVVLVAHDAAGLDAIHEFLRYQIPEHGTGDPLTAGR